MSHRIKRKRPADELIIPGKGTGSSVGRREARRGSPQWLSGGAEAKHDDEAHKVMLGSHTRPDLPVYYSVALGFDRNEGCCSPRFFEHLDEAYAFFHRLSEFIGERGGLTDDSVDIPSILCDVEEEAPASCDPCFVLLKRIVGKCEEREAVSRPFRWKNDFERSRQAEEDPLYS